MSAFAALMAKANAGVGVAPGAGGPLNGASLEGLFPDLASSSAGLELTYSPRPPSNLLASLIRLIAFSVNIPISSHLLKSQQEEKTFLSTCSLGPFLPVLNDDAQMLTISQPLAAVEYLMKHPSGTGPAQLASYSKGDQLRATLATETVIRLLRENTSSNSSAPSNAKITQQLKALSAILTQAPLSEDDMSGLEMAPGQDDTAAAAAAEGQHKKVTVTFGDLSLWFFCDVVCKLNGPAVLMENDEEEELIPLRQLYKALPASSRGVRDYLQWKKDTSGGTQQQAPSMMATQAAAGAGKMTGPPPVAAPAPASAPAPAPAPAHAPAPAPKAPVAVTGANGFIASHLVRILLEAGETVHATVRSLKDVSKYEHLISMPGASPSTLKMFEADLTVPGSFDAAFAGCRGIYHTASPFFFALKKGDPEEELMKPAVEGTRNALRSALKVPTVKRIVLTSSVAAVYLKDPAKTPADHYYTEDDWSDLEFLRANKQHYAESKLVAEREAWRIMKEEVPAERKGKVDLVAICPTLVVGPLLQLRPCDASLSSHGMPVNQSCEQILELLDGRKTAIPNKQKCVVDVRDTALAHYLAMENPRAHGRYLLINESLPWRVICDMLRRVLPGTNVPTAIEGGEGQPAPYPQALSSKRKVRNELGLSYTPVEDSLRDCALSLFALGYLDAVIKPMKDPRQQKGEGEE